MDILIFGTGLFYKNRKASFAEDNIIAFIDNNINKIGTVLDGIDIISVNEIKTKEYDYICLMAKKEFAIQMKNQLLDLEIPEEKIIHYTQYMMLNGNGSEAKFFYWENCLNGSEKKVLLLTNELSYTGAPLVLFDVAKILKERGYFIAVLSCKDGKLRSDYVKNGMMVVVQKEMRQADAVLVQWALQFDLIWGNTLACYNWVDKLNKSGKPFVWWLHESSQAYEHIGREKLMQIVTENVHTYAVGTLALNTARRYFNNINIKELLYGISDFGSIVKSGERKSNKIVLAIIGSICERKAQDIFLDAIEKLPSKIQENAEFWIVGDSLEEEYFNMIQKKSKGLMNVKLLGNINREEMQNIYSQIDVLVCPSREDPMPVVVTEAMAASKPSIVSTMTGTVNLITDKINGFVCNVNDSKQLSEKIKWIFEHKNELKIIGDRARRLYEMNFSLESFKKSINEIIENVM